MTAAPQEIDSPVPPGSGRRLRLRITTPRSRQEEVNALEQSGRNGLRSTIQQLEPSTASVNATTNRSLRSGRQAANIALERLQKLGEALRQPLPLEFTQSRKLKNPVSKGSQPVQETLHSQDGEASLDVPDSCFPDAPQVAEWELYFLIAKFLAVGRCRGAFELLKNEVEKLDLLPERICWDGSRRRYTYEEMDKFYGHIRGGHLAELAEHLSWASSQLTPQSPGPIRSSISTLLGKGGFNLAPRRADIMCSMRLARIEQTSAEIARLNARGGRTVTRLGRSSNFGSVSGFCAQKLHELLGVNCTRVRLPCALQGFSPRRVFRGHKSSVYCSIYDSAGEKIVTGSDDWNIKIWSANSGALLHTCRGHFGHITFLCVSQCNTFLASASDDGTARVWSLQSGLCVACLRGHEGAVNQVAFSPVQGEFVLISVGDDGTCRIWDLKELSANNTPSIIPPKCFSVLDPRRLASEEGNCSILSAAFDSSGKYFAAGGQDWNVRVWNMNTFALEATLSGHKGDVAHVSFGGWGQTLLSGSADGTIRIWEPTHIEGRPYVSALKASFPIPMPWNCKLLLDCNPTGQNDSVRSMQASRPQPRKTSTSTNNVCMATWTRDGRHVIASASDCAIRVWDVLSGCLIHVLRGHSGKVYVMDAHPLDPRIFLTVGRDGRVILWDILKGDAVCTWGSDQELLRNSTPAQMGDSHSYELLDGAFSPCGNHFVVSDNFGQFTIYSCKSLQCHRTFPYDQFFSFDYNKLIHDNNGHAIDEETGETVDVVPKSPELCDFDSHVYCDEIQAVCMAQRLGYLDSDTSDDVFPKGALAASNRAHLSDLRCIAGEEGRHATRDIELLSTAHSGSGIMPSSVSNEMNFSLAIRGPDNIPSRLRVTRAIQTDSLPGAALDTQTRGPLGEDFGRTVVASTRDEFVGVDDDVDDVSLPGPDSEDPPFRGDDGSYSSEEGRNVVRHNAPVRQSSRGRRQHLHILSSSSDGGIDGEESADSDSEVGTADSDSFDPGPRRKEHFRRNGGKRPARKSSRAASERKSYAEDEFVEDFSDDSPDENSLHKRFKLSPRDGARAEGLRTKGALAAPETATFLEDEGEKYCLCNRVCFGEMIGCDNRECKLEWFHIECVGLKEPPEGAWFCPDCCKTRISVTSGRDTGGRRGRASLRQNRSDSRPRRNGASYTRQGMV